MSSLLRPAAQKLSLLRFLLVVCRAWCILLLCAACSELFLSQGLAAMLDIVLPCAEGLGVMWGVRGEPA